MNRPRTVRLALVAILAGALALPALTAALSRAQAPPKLSGKVARVIDGDTIKLDSGERVRLVGVDCPESVHPKKPVQRFGKEAAAFTRKHLQGERVYLVFDQNNARTKHRDRYGRLLAYVYRERDNLDFCAELVKQGYAYAYLKYPSERGEEFLRYQREAREGKRGLWAEAPATTGKGKGGDSRAVDAKQAGSVTVYVTARGKKYHTAGCRHLTRTKRAIPLSEAAKRYEPCKVCRPPVLKVKVGQRR